MITFRKNTVFTIAFLLLLASSKAGTTQRELDKNNLALKNVRELAKRILKDLAQNFTFQLVHDIIQKGFMKFLA